MISIASTGRAAAHELPDKLGMSADLTLSPTALLGARAATEQILDELGLLNYRFDVEPRASTVFDVFIEHERDGAWHTVGIEEPARRLLAAPTDDTLRAEIAERWHARLFSRPPG